MGTQGRLWSLHSTHGWNSHSLPLDQFHIVFRAGIILIGAQGTPEVGPELAMAGKHGGYYLPVHKIEEKDEQRGQDYVPYREGMEFLGRPGAPWMRGVGHLFCSIKMRKVSGLVRTASASRLK